MKPTRRAARQFLEVETTASLRRQLEGHTWDKLPTESEWEDIVGAIRVFGTLDARDVSRVHKKLLGIQAGLEALAERAQALADTIGETLEEPWE